MIKFNIQIIEQTQMTQIPGQTDDYIFWGGKGIRAGERGTRGLVFRYYLAKAFECLQKEGWPIKKGNYPIPH